MLRCKISTGTPRSPKTPVLTADATGTKAGPEIESRKNQCVTSAPGAMKSKRVATKAIRGEASVTARKGTSRVMAVRLSSRIVASRDLTHRVNRYLRQDGWLRERLQAHTAVLKALR
jgi:hypothetical protein